MLLLRFSVDNHRSFRDEADLVLASPSLTTVVPRSGDWVRETSRVSLVYGPNASGKSALIDALGYAISVVGASATEWAGLPRLPRAPFLLDQASRLRPSSFVFEFVERGVRYEYGFAVDSGRIEEEWLFSYPKAKRRTLFERGPGVQGMTFARGFGRGAAVLADTTGERELVVSKGSALRIPLMQTIFDALTGSIDVVRFGDSERSDRLNDVMESILRGDFTFSDLVEILKVADLGISGTAIEEQAQDPELIRALSVLLHAGRGVERRGDGGLEEFAASLPVVARSLVFEHQGAGGGGHTLGMEDQSTGTLMWLAIAAPAVRTLRRGGVLAIDELDASLHPGLSAALIGLFLDPVINPKGAQLIATTHDTYFLSPASELDLAPNDVWFVEKDREGCSDLFRLADFPTRADHNFSRRYLQGRYGAVPALAPSLLASLVREPAPVEAVAGSSEPEPAVQLLSGVTG